MRVATSPISPPRTEDLEPSSRSGRKGLTPALCAESWSALLAHMIRVAPGMPACNGRIRTRRPAFNFGPPLLPRSCGRSFVWLAAIKDLESNDARLKCLMKVRAPPINGLPGGLDPTVWVPQYPLKPWAPVQARASIPLPLLCAICCPTSHGRLIGWPAPWSQTRRSKP